MIFKTPRNKAVSGCFHKAVSSFQSRVFVTAKKFKEINIIDQNDNDLELKQIDKVAKKIEKD